MRENKTNELFEILLNHLVVMKFRIFQKILIYLRNSLRCMLKLTFSNRFEYPLSIDQNKKKYSKIYQIFCDVKLNCCLSYTLFYSYVVSCIDDDQQICG